ncbi:patatin (plasmid) [Scytonema sp. HK-05]|uniref:patatin-like phospholipase family protein n=1 Tax=Scytonema sp. HK-05 TaxID=1137095 RepID=UPI000A5D4EA7|nr:patatin-like phospholipase family protein [Scytonema sp. HK-05]BAY50333.1 patatin [Scytonema sp. HK-05]
MLVCNGEAALPEGFQRQLPTAGDTPSVLSPAQATAVRRQACRASSGGAALTAIAVAVPTGHTRRVALFPPSCTSQSEVIVTIQPHEQSKTLTHEESQETMITTANPKYKILAINGGGIRGIIPALMLAEIEKRTQKPIFSLFDLIAGTSSGGILALGSTKPRLTSELSENLSVAQYSAEELVQIFLEYGCEIFYEPFDKLCNLLSN